MFWKLAKENLDAEWALMCPHEILTVKGYALEDYWGEEWERRYRDCVADPRISKRMVTVKQIVRLVLKSAVETGTPFTFNRDLVNRMNPNGHKGMIYCSNLCTEIAQNMAPIEEVSQTVETAVSYTHLVPATLAALRRTQAGPYTQEQAVGFEQIQQARDEGRLEQLLLSVETVFAHLPVWQVDETGEKRLRNGAPVYRLSLIHI